MLRAKLMRGLIPVALVFGLGIVVTPEAGATVTVTVKIDGVTIDTFSGTKSASKDYANLTDGTTSFTNITISAKDNVPGTLLNGKLSQNSVTADGSSGSGTLEVDVVETDPFTKPGASGTPMLLTSGISRSDGTMKFTFQSFATDISNNPVTPGVQTAGPSPTFSGSVSTTFTRGASYSLSSILTIKAGDTLNDTGTTTVTALPEPATLIMAALGLPMLGITTWRRRKAVKA